MDTLQARNYIEIRDNNFGTTYAYPLFGVGFCLLGQVKNPCRTHGVFYFSTYKNGGLFMSNCWKDICEKIISNNSSSFYSIPVNILRNGSSYKVGISANVTVSVYKNPQNQNDGTTTVTLSGLYEFDTGGPGAYIAFNPNGGSTLGASSSIANPIAQVTQGYYSGIQYQATVAPTVVTLQGLGPAGNLVVPANVALVTSITNTKSDEGVGYNGFPIYEGFYGDFGAALGVVPLTAISPLLAPAVPANPPYMISVLAQVIANGAQQAFMVLLPPASEVGSDPTGYILIGDTASLLSILSDYGQFSMGGQKSVNVGASTDVNSYAECLIQDAVLTADVPQSNPQQKRFTPIGVCFDTGATTTVHPGSNLEVTSDAVSNIALGASTVGGQSWNLIHDRGATTPVAPKPSKNDLQGYVNTGVEFFMKNAVLYDLAGGNLYVMPYSSTNG
ncbi:hypothetical protein UCD39_25345 [Nitrospirillum sp. BR 11752]|uniref:hypothetical protein n=1 Tax=Nitrospirillum sp. BR 11752 TaxID=3104293 RepID=UPI002EA435C9|nr:hypothetical protein [Nitrospirillum sp. BR 11752]